MFINSPNFTRSSRQEVFSEKGNLKICSKFTGEHPCVSAILIKLLYNFTGITLRHWCSPVNLLPIFSASFLKNTFRRLLLFFSQFILTKTLFFCESTAFRYINSAAFFITSRSCC